MRAFFALPLPGAPRRALSAWMATQNLPRAVSPDNLHLTLAFLGDVGPEVLARAAAGAAAVATHHAHLALASQRVSAFPRLHGARILFLELAASEGLKALVVDLRAVLAASGVPSDGKPFVPHITLARPRTRCPLPEPPPRQAWTARERVLLESRPEIGGRRYFALDAWELIAPPPA